MSSCGHNAPTPEQRLAHYENDYLAFDAPSTWQLQDQPGVAGTMGGPLLIFANYSPAASLCWSGPGGAGCDGSRLGSMPANGALVVFGASAALSLRTGHAMTIGGRPALVTGANGMCATAGADRGEFIDVQRDAANYPANYWYFNGCFRGPAIDSLLSKFHAMLTTVRFKA